MANNVQTDPNPSLTSLVEGIIHDAQELMRQELALARREVKGEVDKAKTAAVSFSAALVVVAIGGVMLCQMLVYLLYWATNERISLWGCYGIVGAVFLAAAAILYFTARSKAKEIDLVPNQTVDSMKENVQWIKNQI